MTPPAASHRQRPFLKWAGGKFGLIDRITAAMPSGGQRLIEPFVGGGALFLNTEFERYLLADKNPDLILLYQLVQAEGANFIDYCAPLFTPETNRADHYYQLRTEFNQRGGRRSRKANRRRAALFLYLNRHGYNGLCRYNASGQFNVPFGSYRRPKFPHEALLAAHHKLQHAELLHADFATVLEQAGAGDVVYCDPPYLPLSKTAHFTRYQASDFGEPDQLRLAECAAQAATRGATVLISNHDHPFTRSAYGQWGAHLTHFSVHRSISCAERSAAPELLALFSSTVGAA